MSCQIVYAGQKLTEKQFEEQFIPQHGDIIEYDEVQYVVHPGNQVGSQLVKGESQLAIYEDGDEAATERLSMLDNIPVYNLDPVGRYTVELGGIDPIFNIPLTALLKKGFKKIGKSAEKNPFTPGNEDDLSFDKGKRQSPVVDQKEAERLLKYLSKKYAIEGVLEDLGVFGSFGQYFRGKISINKSSPIDKDGNIIAATEPTGNVYRRTIFHEYLHPFVQVLAKQNPELYQKLVADAKERNAKEKFVDISHYESAKQDEEILVRYLDRLSDQDKPPTLFRQFLSWLSRLFFKNRTNQKASFKLLSASTTIEELYDVFKDYGNIKEDLKKEGLLKISLLHEHKNPEVQQKIADSFQQKRDKYSVQKIEGKDPAFQDDEETNGYKRTLNGVTDWVKKRVTDFVKELKSPQTIAKFEQAPAEKKKEWKEKAEYGTKFHKDAENIIKSALDNEGYLKPHDQVNYSQLSTTLPSAIREPLIAYLVGTRELPGILYTQFPQGTLFKVEEILYDEKRDVAGTIDLMGITPEGKVIIWDWKTKFLNKTQFDDVPFYSLRDYRVQLGQYKNVLKTYGVKPEDVVVAQAQPIIFSGGVSKSGDVTLQSVELPSIDIKGEQRKYLVPVPVEEQSTGNAHLDEFIKSLYKLYQDVYNTASQDKHLKNEQLNSISSAIRELQIKQNFAPVAQEANTFMLSINSALKDQKELFKGDVAPGFENLPGGKEAFDTLLSRITTIMENIDKYAGLADIFEDIYGTEDLTEDQQKVYEQLQRVAGATVSKRDKVKKAFQEMMQWFASKYGVERILDNEKTVTGAIDRNIQSTSKIQTYAIELFYKLESEAKSRRDVAIQERLSGFQKVLDPFKKYAASKGLSPRNFFTLITGSENSNKLLAKLKDEVYKKLEEATDPKKAIDKKWLEENVNMDKVREIAAQKIAARNQAIDSDLYSLDTEEDNRIKKERKAQYAAQWDFSEKGAGWYNKDILRQNIKEERWYTEEYKKIKSQPEVLALYQWIEEFNFEALKSGYHDNTSYFSKRFLPWVKGSFLDKLGKKGLTAFSDSVKNLWTLHEDEKQMYGKGDELRLPTFFTHDDRKNKESLEEVSTDIGSNMALYIQAVLDYQAMSEIEDYADAIVTLEQSKDHLKLNRQGNIVIDNGKVQTDPGNEENARLLQSQVEMLLYKRNYDKTSGLPEEANKTVEAVNNFMRLKVFSLNVIMPFVNTVGSNLQAGINAGRVFRGSEWLKNEARLVGNLFQEQEGNLIKGMVDYFMPLLENENHRTGKQMSAQALKKWTIGDVLLGHIRKSDRIIQLTTAMTMLENTMVDPEGKLVNIREYYLNSKEYRDRYKKTDAERRQLEKGFEKKVQELKDQHGILKKAKFNKDGILEIEGVDRNSETYHQYRRKIQNEISNIVGQISENEKRDMERNVLLKSMMMFKSWIPSLMEKRVGQIKKNASTDQYEIGRARVFFRILFYGAGEKRGNAFTGILQGMKDLRDMKAANERGVKLLNEYYQAISREYFEKTGKELQLTPEQFYDMARQAIAMQAKDMLALISLIMMGFGIGAVPPDDDADRGTKNIYKNLSRIADKLKDEVTFYYNPLSASSILGGGVVPGLGVITDGLKTLNTLGRDITGDDDIQKKTHSIKAVLKNFPVAFQGTQFFLPLISPETANDLGVKVASNNNYR
jgi:hypothetical protein